jgi:diguanylate cyclase (GGDEF)-like protein
MSHETLDHQAVLAHLQAGVLVVDVELRVVLWNHALAELSGIDLNVALGQRIDAPPVELLDDNGRHVPPGVHPISRTLGDGEARSMEGFLRHADGQLIAVVLHLSRVTRALNDAPVVVAQVAPGDKQAQTGGASAPSMDVALTDGETSLGSQHLLEMHLVSRLSELARYGWHFGLVKLVISNYAALARHHGALERSRVLRALGATLAHATRASDRAGRWQDDVFMVVAANVDHGGLAVSAERYRRLVEGVRVAVNGEPAIIQVDMGVALARENDSIATLLARVEQAFEIDAC